MPGTLAGQKVTHTYHTIATQYRDREANQTLQTNRLAANAIPWYKAQLGAMLHKHVAGRLLRVDTHAVCVQQPALGNLWDDANAKALNKLGGRAAHHL